MINVALNQKVLVEEYLKTENHFLSAFSFVNIFAWRDFFDFRFEVINDELCVFAHQAGACFLYLPPLGPTPSFNTIEGCFERMEEINKGNGVSRIENVHEKQLPFFPPEEFDYFKKGYEYCYYRKDLAALKGNAYKSKRNACNYFTRHYQFKFLPFDYSMGQECAHLYTRWANNRQVKYQDEIYLTMLEENKIVHRSVLRNYAELGLVGRVVMVNDGIEGYSFGFPLASDIFCVLFEIVNLEIKGLPVYVFREFCRDPQLKPFKFINVMDDFGLPQIERTKLSFQPCVLFPAYVVTRKKNK